MQDVLAVAVAEVDSAAEKVGVGMGPDPAIAGALWFWMADRFEATEAAAAAATTEAAAACLTSRHLRTWRSSVESTENGIPQ